MCVCVCFTAHFSWVKFSVLGACIFVTSIFNSEVNCAVYSFILFLYLFSSNRSVTPFNSLSLLSPQSRSLSLFFVCSCVCVYVRVFFFALVKTHSFICSLSLLFRILLCVNPLYIFWTNMCVYSSPFVSVCVSHLCVVLFLPLKHLN